MKEHKILFNTTVEEYVILVERIKYNPQTGGVYVDSYCFGNNGLKLHRIPYETTRVPKKNPLCNFCNTKLVEGVNWYRNDIKKRCYTCKKCQQKKSREYARANIIGTTDKDGNRRRIKTTKRPYTGKCEFCGWEGNVLAYHHWDDTKPCCGIWVCHYCHKLVEWFEKEPTVIDRYNEFKRRIETELKVAPPAKL